MNVELLVNDCSDHSMVCPLTKNLARPTPQRIAPADTTKHQALETRLTATTMNRTAQNVERSLVVSCEPLANVVVNVLDHQAARADTCAEEIGRGENGRKESTFSCTFVDQSQDIDCGSGDSGWEVSAQLLPQSFIVSIPNCLVASLLTRLAAQEVAIWYCHLLLSYVSEYDSAAQEAQT